MVKKDRDIEKGYSNEQIVEKLRRLADCIESGKNFEYRLRASASMFPPVPNLRSNMNAKTATKSWNSSLNGRKNKNGDKPVDGV